MLNGGFRLTWTVVLLSVLALAQAGPRITAVEPATCAAGDALTVTGENLGGNSLEVLLSQDGENYPAEVVERAKDKMKIKVPKVRPGSYRLALKIDDSIYVEPVEIAVE